MPLHCILPEHLSTMPPFVSIFLCVAQVGVLCTNPAAGSGTISVVLLSKASSLPILQAQLRMPMSEMVDD